MPPRQKESRASTTVDTGIVKAIGHPLRMRLLSRLNETVASPVELARELDESVQLVSYHVRILRDLGFVELVSTTPRRGAIEHHYRAVRRPLFSDADWAALPANARASLAGEIIQSLFQHAGAALEAGAFDERGDTQVSFSDLVLDEQGWTDLNTRIGALVKAAQDIQAKSAARIKKGGPELRTRLALLHYPSPEGAEATPNLRSTKTKPRARRAKSS